jgi:hypothetical protein
MGHPVHSQVFTEIGDRTPPNMLSRSPSPLTLGQLCLSLTCLLLSLFLSVHSLFLPSLYHFANFLTPHVPFHEPSSNNFKRAFSTKTWRARNSGGHSRRTWALPVPVRANKLPKIQAPLPIRATHIFSKCECNVGAL